MKKSILVAALLSIYIKAYSSGYMIEDNSTDVISTASSNVIEVTNPSVMANNPAGITYLDGTQISSSLIGAFPKIKYKNAKGYYFKTHEPIKGETSNNSISHALYAPSFFVSHQINDKYYTGIAIYPVMGAVVDYNMQSVLRYNINKINLIAVNINPVLSFKINDNQSLGFGIVGQYIKAQLREFVDMTLGVNHEVNSKLGGYQLNLFPKIADGYANVRGMDTAYGFNLGYIWDIKDNLRFGISYISKIKHTLTGNGSWEFYGEGFDWPILGKLFRDGVRDYGYVAKEGGNVKFNSPDNLNISFLYKANDKLNLMTNASWTHNGILDEIKINFENYKKVPNGKTGRVDGKSNYLIIKPVWKNTWRFSIGATYQLNDKLQLRTGISYDKTPITDPSSRYNVLPDNDRLNIGMGANYSISPNKNLTFGYVYIKAKNSSSSINGWCGGPELGPNSLNCVDNRTATTADFKSSAHLVGIQYNYKF